MAAGLIDRVMHMADVVGLIDARAAEMPIVRGPYRKKVDEISTEAPPAFCTVSAWRFSPLGPLGMLAFSIAGPTHYNPHLRISGKLRKGGART
jgi:hypothetical protein